MSCIVAEIHLFVNDVFLLEFPQNYPHRKNLPRPVIHNFQKMPKI